MKRETLLMLVIVLLIVLLIYWLLCRVARSIGYRLGPIRRTFGTLGWIIEAIKLSEAQVATTPKTLSIKEPIYQEAIKRDFPELNLELAKSYMNEVVADYLNCLETGDTTELEEDCTENLVVQAKNRKNGKQYRNIRFHRTAVNGYSKTGTEAVIVFQTACQYQLNNKLHQTRFEAKYVYYLKETIHNVSAVMRCSYCGAPVEGLGEKVCRYCGNGVTDTLKKTWQFSDIKEF